MVQKHAPRVESVPTPPSAPAPAPVRTPAAPVNTTELLQSSGLVMIETDASKAHRLAPEPEPVQLGRPRRERPQAVEEPLQQVETKN